MEAQALTRAREVAAEVRAWLATYHCLGGENFQLGPEGSGVVLIMDFAACPILGYLDQHAHAALVNDLFQRLDRMGLYVRRGAVFSELRVYNKEDLDE
jgi:hypothetical protein